MARLQMDKQQEQFLNEGYTHKKFNCSYSHKKLGLCLRQRELDDKENILEQKQQQQLKIKQTKTNKTKDLFRPYALDDKKTRNRATARSTETAKENSALNLNTSPTLTPNNYEYQQQPTYPATLEVKPPSSVPAQCFNIPAPPTNYDYTLRLQRQRAALYMHYLAQFQQLPALNVQPVIAYPMGYPNVTAPIFNGC